MKKPKLNGHLMHEQGHKCIVRTRDAAHSAVPREQPYAVWACLNSQWFALRFFASWGPALAYLESNDD